MENNFAGPVQTLPDVSYIRLSDLTRRVENAIKQTFGSESYWVLAEISSHKYYPNNDRHYFEFVEKADGSADPIAKVRGVAWVAGSQTIKTFQQATGQLFTNGIQVLVKVKVEFHQAYGLSLVLMDIDQNFTLGNIEKQRRETLLRLVAENPGLIEKSGEEYLTKNKRVPLNVVIQHIAIIASPNSEGYADFSHTIQYNQYKYTFGIDIYQSAVQGADAERELINKLISIYESGKKYDCVVIIRGGGAKSDFLVFDTYQLARTVARFPIPVITGIGHHKDVSIVDLMANISTKTPTQAAEFIIAHNRSFEDNVMSLQKTVIIKTQQLLSDAIRLINYSNNSIINNSRTIISHRKERLNEFNQRVINATKSVLYNRQTKLVSLLNQLLSRPQIITSNKKAELENIAGNLKLFSGKLIRNQNQYLNHFRTVINMMSPENILRKGFAMISKNGLILKNAEQIKPGDELIISMQDSEVNTTVNSKTKKDAGKSDV